MGRNRLLLGAFLSVLLCFSLVVSVKADVAMWGQTYGGAGDDFGRSLVETLDGGYVIAGYTTSFGAGSYDFWLIKTNASGNMEWNQTYGGTEDDRAFTMVATSDGGYALVGSTDSFGAGSVDFWLVKTDAYGNEEWNHTYGETGYEAAYSLVEVSDGGYALAGSKEYYDEEHDILYGGFWVVKTDSLGNMQWNETYGGLLDVAHSLVETADGGFAIAGTTWSYNTNGGFWLIKTDAYGNEEWNQTYRGYGGITYYFAYHDCSLVATADGGYAIAGYANSFGALYGDFWLLKTDASGNLEWQQSYAAPYKPDFEMATSSGELCTDIAHSLVETSDGGFAIAGETDQDWIQTGPEVGSYYKADGFWFVKTDEFGNMEWNQTYGGTGDDRAFAVVASSDGGYALAGYTGSFGAGGYDLWVVKADENGVAPVVPEAAWVVLPLLATATVAIFVSKKKLLNKPS